MKLYECQSCFALCTDAKEHSKRAHTQPSQFKDITIYECEGHECQERDEPEHDTNDLD